MKRIVEIQCTPAELAEAFCSMNDEQQAQFFIDVAKIARGWGAYERDLQFQKIGEHLATCECSNDDARDIVENMHLGMVPTR